MRAQPLVQGLAIVLGIPAERGVGTRANTRTIYGGCEGGRGEGKTIADSIAFKVSTTGWTVSPTRKPAGNGQQACGNRRQSKRLVQRQAQRSPLRGRHSEDGGHKGKNGKRPTVRWGSKQRWGWG